MLKLYRGLVDAKFLTYAQVNFGYLSGSVEFDSSGKGINQDAKYNQWDFQQKQLPAYADHEFDGSRSGAINAMRLMATVANASPLTGTTVAKETYSPQDRSYGVTSNGSVTVNISELAKRLANGEKVEDLEVPQDVDIVDYSSNWSRWGRGNVWQKP